MPAPDTEALRRRGAETATSIPICDHQLGDEAARHLFGERVAPWVSLLVAVGLATTVGALVMTGPRIYERMGEDHPRLAVLASPRAGRGPVRAIVLQTVVALVLAATATSDALLTYMGFTLSIQRGPPAGGRVRAAGAASRICPAPTERGGSPPRPRWRCC